MLASLTTVAATGWIFMNYVGAHLSFFGDPVVIYQESVTKYWVGLAAFGCSMLVAFVAAWRREANGAFIWHAGTALVGLIVSFAFAVTQTGIPQQPPPPDLPEQRGNSVCHSGGDSDGCIGG